MTLVDNNGQPLTVAEAEEFNGRFMRDNFAAFALSGLLAADVNTEWSTEHAARAAYEMADAMLRERSK